MFENYQDAGRADHFPPLCVGFPAIRKVWQETRLGWQKNLLPLAILPFFKQGLAVRRSFYSRAAASRGMVTIEAAVLTRVICAMQDWSPPYSMQSILPLTATGMDI